MVWKRFPVSASSLEKNLSWSILDFYRPGVEINIKILPER